jgi:hypothetical protein
MSSPAAGSPSACFRRRNRGQAGLSAAAPAATKPLVEESR